MYKFGPKFERESDLSFRKPISVLFGELLNIESVEKLKFLNFTKFSFFFATDFSFIHNIS